MDKSTIAADIAVGALERFVQALRARDLETTISLFTEDAILYGSEVDEVATGIVQLRSFFEDIYAGSATFGWTWDAILAGMTQDVVWFVVPATTRVLRDDGTETTFPYRLSGVLRHQPDGSWCFAMFNGSEPAASH